MMSDNRDINLLVIVIVASEQINELTPELIKGGFYFTRIDSSGGILERATISLLVGINKIRLEPLMRIIRTCCHTRLKFIPARVEAPLMQGQPLMIEAEMGGAIVYTVEVERFEQI
jgi:uncharacterized protein YaaQ